MTSLALVGARGHTGGELIRLIAGHPQFELVLASSRALAGQPVAEHVPDYQGNLAFSDATPEQVAKAKPDAVVLAMPNGLSAPHVAALEGAVLVDLSADHRFTDDWHYGLPELTRGAAAGKRRIANPGCYATAMQLALHPLKGALAGVPQCFGVSGYSGAGTSPSDKNNPDKLRDNLMPYAPFEHIHEREVSRQLATPVRFMPHVAAFFRGILMTVTATLNDDLDVAALLHDAYADEPLVRVSDAAPWVADNAGQHYACVGGVAQREREVVVYATLDNLLKGAATQALQNLNLACGHDEFEGIACD